MSDTLYLNGDQWETRDLINHGHSYRVNGDWFEIQRIEVHWSDDWDKEGVFYPINGSVNISRYHEGTIERAVLIFRDGQLMFIERLPAEELPNPLI